MGHSPCRLEVGGVGRGSINVKSCKLLGVSSCGLWVGVGGPFSV